MPENPNILIGLPAYGGSVRTHCALSLARLVHALTIQGIKFRIQTLDATNIDEARSALASLALESPEITHLGQLDYDMTFNPSAYLRMLALKQDVIGCVCPRRNIDMTNLKPNDFNVWFERPTAAVATGGVMEVDAIGTAISLTSTHSLRALVKTGRVAERRRHAFGAAIGLLGPLFGFYDRMERSGELLSEDLSFCVRWRELCGGSVYAIIDEQIGHIGLHTWKATLQDMVEQQTR